MKKAIKKILVIILIFGTCFGMIPGMEDLGYAVNEATHGHLGLQVAEAADPIVVPSVTFGYFSGTSFVQHAVKASLAENGYKVTPPSNPSKPGYEFLGWYTFTQDSDNMFQGYTGLFDFNTQVRQNLVLLARWKKTVNFKAYNLKSGAEGVGGKITITGSFPGTTASSVGPAANFQQAVFEEEMYNFKATPDNGFAFKGWYWGSVSGNQLTNFTSFSYNIQSMEADGQSGNILYAAFEPKETTPYNYNWTLLEGETGGKTMPFTTSTDNYPSSADGLYTVDDPSNITTHAWEGLDSNGNIPANSTATFVVTYKDNIPVGNYRVTVTFNNPHGNDTVYIYNVTVNHKFTKMNALAATCTTQGHNEYWTCSVCGKVYSDGNGTNETTVAAMTIPAKGHNYGAWTKDNNNRHKRTCANDSSHVEYQAHTWNQGVVTKEPTETATGVRTYTCSVCNGTKTETIPVLTHTHTYGAWTKLNDTQHQRVCSKNTSHVEKQNHTWDAGTVTQPATENSTGIKTYTCTVCNGTKTETIPKLSHVHSLVKTEATPATCEAVGNKAYWTCTGCGKHFSNANGTTETTIAAQTLPALGHNYGVWTKLNDNQHQRVCARDNSHVERQNHAWDAGTVTKPATETQTGTMKYTCTVCSATRTETIPKLNHVHSLAKTNAKSATCTEPGNRAYWTCTGCGKVFSNEAGTTETTVAAQTIPALGHNYGAWTEYDANQHQRVCVRDTSHVERAYHTWNNGVVIKEPTETANGTKRFTCTVCNATRDEAIPALQHTHNLVKTEAKAATCTAEGNKAYWTCRGCGKIFSDAAGTKETSLTAMLIAAKGHNYGAWTSDSDTAHKRVCANDSSHVERQGHSLTIRTTPATCTETGSRTTTCSICNYQKNEVLPKVSHILTKVNAKAATCTTSGNTEHYRCGTCNKYFSDSAGKNEINASSTLINPKGHSYGVWTKLNDNEHQRVCANDSSHVEKQNHSLTVTTLHPNCTSTGLRTSSCAVCGFLKEEVLPKVAHSLVKIPKQDATCSGFGVKEHYRCNDCGGLFSDSQGKTPLDFAQTLINPKGHNYGGWTKLNDNQHRRVCKNDSSHTEVQNHSWGIGVVTKPATETEDGVRTYTCISCNATKTEAIPKSGHTHDFGAWSKLNDTQHQRVCSKNSSHVEKENHQFDTHTVLSTCTSEGVKTSTCRTCGFVKTEKLPKLAHTLSKVVAKAATCNAAGNIEYYKCSVCNKYFRDSAGKTEISFQDTVVPRLNHSYGNWTKLNDNEHQRVCANDKTHVEKEYHAWDNGVVTKEPTDKQTGIKTYTCTVCNAKKTEPIPMANHEHSYGPWINFSDSEHQRICTKDTSHVEKQGHSFNTNTRLPSCREEGLKTSTCATCGYVKEEVLSKTAHTLIKISAVSATCNRTGNITYYQCIECAKYFKDSKGTQEISYEETRTPLVDHKWDAGKVTREATETQTGIKTYTCSVCGATKTEMIPMLSHTHSFGAWTKLNDSQHQRICSKDATHVEVQGHTWDAGKVTKAATETQEGQKTFTCSVCKGTKVEPVPALGHTHDYGAWTKENDDNHKRVCSKDSSHVESQKHVFNVHTVLATCWSEGLKTSTCTVCGFEKKEVIPKKDHTLTKVNANAATCTEEGNIEFYKCSECNDYFKDAKGKTSIAKNSVKIKALGHDYGEYVKLNDEQHQRTCKRDTTHVETVNHRWRRHTDLPSCSTEGKETRTCLDCGHVVETVLPTTEHKLKKVEKKDPTCTTLGNTEYYQCTTCFTYFADAKGKTEIEHSDTVLYTIDHKWDAGKITREATIYSSGLKTYTCSVCKRTRTETIPRLKDEIWKRIFGQNAYDTMEAVVKEGFSAIGGTVVVATGKDYYDALAAAGIAGVYNAPVVLTKPNTLPDQARRAIARLKPKVILVAGGPAAVSDQVLRQIRQATGVEPWRMEGQDAPATSAEIATMFGNVWSGERTAILATTKSFHDALAAAPVSYAKHYPILLVKKGTTLTKEVKDALKELGIKNVIIVGGTNAIDDSVVTELKKMGIVLRKRLYGDTAIETSAKIAEWGIKNGMSPNYMGVATSASYYDALSGAALCGKNNAVLVLEKYDKNKVPNRTNTKFPTPFKATITRGFVFGGTAAVTDITKNALENSVS